jgi:(S)-mandelate dehydrogenase
LSNASTIALEEIAQQAGGRVWMQLYLYRTREYTARLVERVDRAGLEALIVTTDSNLFGNREWDRRNYARPLQLNLRNMFDVLCHPRWLFDVLIPHGAPRFKNLGDLLLPGQDSARGAASALAKEFDPSLNWKDIRWLRGLWPRTLIVKGILTVEDALLAAECGADGIVLTNHGGRQLDGAISSRRWMRAACAGRGGRLLSANADTWSTTKNHGQTALRNF